MILSHFVNEWGFKYGRCICFSMCLLKLYLLKQVYYDGNITALRFNMHQMRFEVCEALTYIVKLFFYRTTTKEILLNECTGHGSMSYIVLFI